MGLKRYCWVTLRRSVDGGYRAEVSYYAIANGEMKIKVAMHESRWAIVAIVRAWWKARKARKAAEWLDQQLGDRLMVEELNRGR